MMRGLKNNHHSDTPLKSKTWNHNDGGGCWIDDFPNFKQVIFRFKIQNVTLRKTNMSPKKGPVQ